MTDPMIMTGRYLKYYYSIIQMVCGLLNKMAS
jgi:hypothetical protein